MAQSITFHSGSPLIGSPITLRVIPEPHYDIYTFHRVVLTVYAALEGDDDYTEFSFSTPVSSSEAVLFDISSALRAVAERYEFEANPSFPKRYPYVKFRVMAYDFYMVDGEEHARVGFASYPLLERKETTETIIVGGETHTVTSVTHTPTYVYAFMGSLTDMDRLLSQHETGIDVLRWTRKPVTSPEIVFHGKTFVRPVAFTADMSYVQYVGDGTGGYPSAPEDGPMSESFEITSDGVVVTEDVAGHETTVYAIRAPADAVELRFVNALGCLESVHLTAAAKKEVNITTDRYAISRQETLTGFSRGLAVKSGNHERWTLTSPPVDEEWVSWYIHELLMARWAWLNVRGVWLACHLLPDETVTLRDREKNAGMRVRFTAELDITGSPLLR